jgi:hypothetical protein
MAQQLLAERQRPGLELAQRIETLSEGRFSCYYWLKIPVKSRDN